MSQPLHASFAFVLILTGFPAYAILRRSQNRNRVGPSR